GAEGGDEADNGGDGSSGDPDADDGSVACLSPNLVCDGLCIDPTSDPNNCGSCGKVCPSNSCVAGACSGTAAGHVVAIGHDYQAIPSMSSSQARVLANAVFIPKSS